MKPLISLALAICATGLSVGVVNAAPAFSKGTSIRGVIAYQDASDPSQFWYFPTTADELLGERLRAYRAVSFGFGPAYYVQDEGGNYKSAAGGIVSGTFAYDISDEKRVALIAAIKRDFSVNNPKLLPLPLRSPEIKSVLLSKIFGKFGEVEQELPTGFQIGPDVAFSAGSANSLFAAVIANLQEGSGIQANPVFSLNINAKAEFVGDPWTFKVHCDLSQVWNQTRSSIGGSVSYGWVTIGTAQYQGIFQDLQKSNVCTFTQVEGSLDTATYGRQIGETMKAIFQAINDSAVNGTGFFKFEPNPDAPPVPGGGGGGGFNLFGWSFSVNAGYSQAFFKQSFFLDRTVSYTGRLEAPVAFSAVMAVACGPETKQFFVDLGNTAESCITQPKIDAFMDRAKRESALKTKKLLELADRYAQGKLTDIQYEKIKALYDVTDFTDVLIPAEVPAALEKAPLVAGGGLPKAAMFVRELSDAQIQSLDEKALRLPTVKNAPGVGVELLRRY